MNHGRQKVIRTIGVLTSGGDAPGMNAAIRAVVRTALGKGLKVRGIRRGYQGLLNEEIIDLSARDVSDTIERGGTILQTARCAEMRTEEGQQKAAAICKKYGIDGLVSSVVTDHLPELRNLLTLESTQLDFRERSISILPVRNIQLDLIQPLIQLCRLLTKYVIHQLLMRDALSSRLWVEMLDTLHCGAVLQMEQRRS